MSDRRMYAAVATVAAAVYLGALWNGFALDDIPLIALNPLVAYPSGLWRAFAHPYWPPDFGGHLYRPLVIAGYTLDRLVDGTPWFHAVNLLWHAAATVSLAALTRRLVDQGAGLVAGLLFALHPVHVEAVANVVGRAEPMAALLAILTVYAALAGWPAAWSAAAFALGLLSKENAAVAPALVVWAWILGLERPGRRRIIALGAGWGAVAAAYTVVRALVLHPYGAYASIAPMFIGQTPLAVRLTAVAALADVARLLVFPLTLRVDYSPNERTAVTSFFDLRLAAGLVCALAWGALLVLAWRRGRKVEAFGLGWLGVALLPVANLLFPVGFYLAERTLYLPSAGLVVAVAAALARWLPERLRPVVAVVCLLAAARVAFRVPVWHDDTAVTESILENSPASYGGPARMAGVYLDHHQPEKALAAARIAAGLMQRDPWVYAIGAVAAFAAGHPGAADSLLSGLERLCAGACAAGYYRYEAAQARAHGYPATADSLLARAARPQAR
ncbi:MAG TPA: hypothetical protein VHO95_13240 [Candidatus Dormibacteraeota bacterium]|nr:hypothetical protein [Candidatus Dormibacteraeota bacterium]